MRRTLALLPALIPAVFFAAFSAACGGNGNGSTTSSSSSSSTGGSGGMGGMIDPEDFAPAPSSCAFQCPSSSCAESTTPYACQNLDPWNKIPHDSACGSWDGNPPPVKQGQCTATAPTGEALKFAGKDPADPATIILPDGRRIQPAGADFVFPDGLSQTSNVVPVSGTGMVLTVDLGYGAHIVRAVDPTQIGKQSPTLSQVDFNDPESLNQGIVFSPPDRVYVASAQGVVQAITLDTATGKLTRDDARSVTLPASPASPGGSKFYSSGVAVSADNTRLFVSGVKDSRFFVADVTAGGPQYGTVLGQLDLGSPESFNLYTDPHDPTTRFVYATMWSTHQVLEVDVSDPAMPKVARSFMVEKDPQGMAFLDARWAVIGNDLGDSLSIVDRASGTVTTVPVETGEALKGIEPSSLTWDEPRSRLYVTQAGYNALSAYDVDLTKTPPTITPAGHLPTAWWPSGVAAMSDGSLVVTTIMAHGVGPRMPMQEYDLLHGSIQSIPAPTMADLSAGSAAVTKNSEVNNLAGYPTVNCPNGADDFPIPVTNTGSKSKIIDHVIFVLRENKTFDGLFGDLPGITGDSTMTMVPAAQMDGIWTNIRKAARTFSHSDNYYTSAFISTQGHLWATHGRTDDFNEREWPVTGYGRSLRGDADSGGVADVARPAEGSLFDWLDQNHVPYNVMGEIVGVPKSGNLDVHYPGGIIQSIGYPDVEKGCYVAGRARVLCDLGNVVYMTLPNDHTQGVSSSNPTPETMFAVNDEATGILIDGISHSPIWKSSLVVVIEDDPAQGGESVDYHRTIMVMASPWVKRGYVSHTHLDIASIHKLIAHVFAIPYPNVVVKNAPLPLDMFTSTPDYTPYTYEKRTYPLACGSNVTSAEESLTGSWDFDDADEQPGLDLQVERWLHHKQRTELSAALEAEIERRSERRAER